MEPRLSVDARGLEAEWGWVGEGAPWIVGASEAMFRLAAGRVFSPVPGVRPLLITNLLCQASPALGWAGRGPQQHDVGV